MKDFFSNIKLSLKLVKDNAKCIIPFVIVSSIFQTSLYNLLIKFLYFITLKVNKLDSLSTITFNKWITSPFTIICIIIILFIFLLVSCFFICSMIRLFAKSKKKVGVFSLIWYGIKTSVKILKVKNIKLFLYILLVVPLTGTFVVTGINVGLIVPEYIESFIVTKWFLLFLVILIYIILYVLSIRWAFMIHYYVLDDDNINLSIAKSKKIMKKSIIKTLLGRILITVILFCIFKVISILICLVVVIFSKLLMGSNGYSFAIYSCYYITRAFNSLFNVFLIPVLYAYLSVIFFNKNKTIEVSNINVPKKFNKSIFKVIGFIFIFILFIINCMIWISDSNNNLNIIKSSIYSPLVIAHRGDSSNHIENTISAFDESVINGADYIELDVQMTKDNVLVVSHDSSLKRVFNIKKNIYSLTYDELKDINVLGNNIPTLEEVLIRYKDKIKLNIELKTTGHENNYVQSVIDLINANNYSYEDYVIASGSYQLITKVKEIDPSIVTVYNMFIANGNIYKLNYADIYSIESSYVNENLIAKVHNKGKKIYVWTINDPSSIKRYANMNIDGIISDSSELVKLSLNNDNFSEKYKILRFVFNIM